MVEDVRRLAAIVSADVAGYSRLMGRDESGTLRRLNAHRAELIDPLIEEHGGRIVKTTGDGLLLEFPSVVAAVQCCITVQDGMLARDADVSDDDAIRFRIGVHLGDVIVEGDDIFGDGVNIAARLQEIGEVGGVVISSNAHDSVEGRIKAAFVDGGDQELKNIARPVQVWSWLPTRQATNAGPRTAEEPLSLPDKPSIVVLPFNNMSGDPEQEFLADGLTEDITTTLSRFRWLFVIARNSAFTYKGKAVDVSQVSRDLGVRYVLEGSVRKSGERIRATAQLIDAETQSHVWAERYDQMLVDVFDLQDEITTSIVGAIEPNLLTAERERLDRKRPTSLSAWECMVRAMPVIWRFDEDSFPDAAKLLRQALDIDPGYARAHSLLASGYALALWTGWKGDPVEASSLAETHARRSIELDASDPWAHLAVGLVLGVRRKNQEALSELETAIKLNPSFSLAHAFRAIVLAWGGRPEDALECFDLAERLSPHDPFNSHTIPPMRATALYVAQRFDEAVEAAREGIRLRTFTAGPYRVLAASCAMAGLLDEARAAMGRLQELQPNISTKWMRESMPMAHKESLDLYIEGLVKAGLPED